MAQTSPENLALRLYASSLKASRGISDSSLASLYPLMVLKWSPVSFVVTIPFHPSIFLSIFIFLAPSRILIPLSM